MRIVFMGTPEPAKKILQALLDAKKEVVLVVTQPDRPKGRRLKVSKSPVKELAEKVRISIETPERVKDKIFIEKLKSIAPDIIVVAAYGKILPKEILDIPKHGCINVHASLLPKYRGAAPIQWALMNGEKETGVTIFRLKETLDTGDIILQKSIPIEDNDDAETLSGKLFDLGGKLLLEAIDLIENGKAEYKPQKEADASYAESLRKESGVIDWHKSAIDIHNRVRAMYPWPGAHTYYNGKILKILKSEIKIVNLETKHKDPGTIIDVVKELGFIVATGKGHILIKEVQPAGKKKMRAFDFCIGHNVKAGVVLPS